MRYPARLLADDEEVVLQFRSHWRLLLPALGWAMLFAAGVGVAFAALDTRSALRVLLAVGLAWLLLSIRTLVRWWCTHHVLTTERLIVRTGLLARRGTEVPLATIDSVRFSQNLWQRLLGYGDVLVRSVASHEPHRLAVIPDPEAFQAEVYHAREERLVAHPGRPRDAVAQLEALADLRERGHLTDEEFAARKRLLLGADLPPSGSESF